jgi:hypothetical protein
LPYGTVRCRQEDAGNAVTDISIEQFATRHGMRDGAVREA